MRRIRTTTQSANCKKKGSTDGAWAGGAAQSISLEA
jgi:hypothetical protein